MKDARWFVDQLLDLQPANKNLGQHFLIDDSILHHIVSGGELDASDHVLEIGPGPGTLTSKLLEQGCKITAIEIDEGACEHLTSVFHQQVESGQLELVQADILDYELPPSITKVIANIPYQISSPLIEKLTKYHLSNSRQLQSMVLLVQNEFAERLEMKTTDTVGSLGLVVSLDFRIEMLDKVAPDAFIPHPKVHSRVVKFSSDEQHIPCDRKLLVMIIRHSFEQRRKKLKSLLKVPPKRLSRVQGWYHQRWKDAFESLREDPILESRPEEIDLQAWFQIVSTMEQHAS